VASLSRSSPPPHRVGLHSLPGVSLDWLHGPSYRLSSAGVFDHTRLALPLPGVAASDLVFWQSHSSAVELKIIDGISRGCGAGAAGAGRGAKRSEARAPKKTAHAKAPTPAPPAAPARVKLRPVDYTILAVVFQIMFFGKKERGDKVKCTTSSLPSVAAHAEQGRVELFAPRRRRHAAVFLLMDCSPPRRLSPPCLVYEGGRRLGRATFLYFYEI
jgi:hypothetical protein